MASKTLTDRVNEISNLLATVAAQLSAVREEIEGMHGEQHKSADFLGEHKTRIALLEQQLSEMKRSKEEWARRAWAIVGPILGALVGVIVGYLLRQ